MLAPPHEAINAEVQIAMISCEPNAINDLLQKEPKDTENNTNGHETFSDEQVKDQELEPIILYLQDGTLPDDDKPIITRPFQIVGVDVMELPVTTQGNRYIIVFQDLFTKWPMVFPTPDQKAERIACLLVEEVVPCFEVPEALLSDGGTNLLSFLMKDICKMLGIEKLNTTASHPRCNGAVERFNRTLESMLRKDAAKLDCNGTSILVG